MQTLNLEDLQILGAVLPSIKEIENLTEAQRFFYYGEYWLRSSSVDGIEEYAAYVDDEGLISKCGISVESEGLIARPALVIENLNSFDLEPGEEVKITDLPDSEFANYVVVNDHMLLANFGIGRYVFNGDISRGNDYWTSDVKKVVDEWFEENFNYSEFVSASNFREDALTKVFSNYGYDITDDAVKLTIEDAAEYLSFDPYCREYNAMQKAKEWFSETQLNYPEHLKGLKKKSN